MRPVLSEDQLQKAVLVGIKRHLEASRMNLKDKHGMRKIDGFSSHINGACGELAASLALGIEWDESVNTFKVPDLGSIHVRTRSEDWHDLIIRKDDPAGIYLLVTGVVPNLTVRGVCDSRRVCVDKYLKTHGGREEAWFIPQSDLSNWRAVLVHLEGKVPACN